VTERALVKQSTVCQRLR